MTESWLDVAGVMQSRTVKYGYDDLDRLTREEVVGGDTVEYAYDAVGNRESVTVIGSGVTCTYAYNDNNHLARHS